MMTAIQIESLRAKARAAQRRPMPSPWQWVRFVNGPLAGMTVKVSADAYDNPKAVHGYCEITGRGPVMAFYVHGAMSDEWRFEGYDYPGARASGIRVE